MQVDGHQTIPSQEISKPLAKILSSQCIGKEGQTGVYMLPVGMDAFAARAALAISATESLDLQYYGFQKDLIGNLMSKHLLDAADRGVVVRMLIDDVDLRGRDPLFVGLNSHPNIHIKMFNPFFRASSRIAQFFARFSQVMRRMHNKAFIVDGRTAVVGGRNIGNEYFDVDPDDAFNDLDALIVGNAIKQLSDAFELYWNHELSVSVDALKKDQTDEKVLKKSRKKIAKTLKKYQQSPYADAVRASDFVQKIKEGRFSFEWASQVDILYDHPEKVRQPQSATEYHMSQDVFRYTEHINHQLTIVSPYFVPGKEGVEFIEALVARGIHVRVFTNSLASIDVTIVHSAYARYRKQLLKMGVEMYEMRRSLPKRDANGRKTKRTFGAARTSLHAKLFVLDENRLFVGSMNLDPRSRYVNTEMGIVLTCPPVALDMLDYFDRQLKKDAYRMGLNGQGKVTWQCEVDGQLKEYQHEPKCGIGLRIMSSILSILPVESQL